MTLSWDDLLKSALAMIFGAGSVGGFWAWMRSRPKGVADIGSAQAAFQMAMNAQVSAFTASLMELTGDQRATIDRLEARVVDLESDNRRCHSENRQLRQMLASLMQRLRAAGIDLPPELAVSAILETETAGGGVTALSGLKTRRAKP